MIKISILAAMLAGISLVPAGTALAGQAGEAVIETVPCTRFTEVADGVTADCGILRVPENRADPGSKAIGVPFLRVRSTAATPAPDPLIFMTGGPGGRTIPRRATNNHPALSQRDVIWLEQRGTALGEPALQCQPYAEAGREAQLGHLDGAGLAAARIEAATACAAEARAAGIDLAGYTSAGIVADIEDLRVSLGLGEVNLAGISYSGRVMSRYAEDHPDVTRSVILYSPMSVESDYDEYGSAGMLRTLNMVLDGCAVTPACARAYPALREDLAAILDAAASAPRTVTVGEDTVTVTGWVLANALLDQLYSPSTFETLPRVIGNIRAGDEAALSGILDTGLSSYAWLMRISVWCNEEVPFQDAGAVARQVEAYPLFQGVDQSTVPQGLCAAAGFGDAAPPARADAPVETDVPVLIIAGALDPATPPAWQKEMVAHLPAGRLVLFPSGGHGVFTPCSGALSTAFWQDPAGPLPAECVLEDTGPDFARAAE